MTLLLDAIPALNPPPTRQVNSSDQYSHAIAIRQSKT